MKTRQCITAYVYDKGGSLLASAKNSYTKTHPIQARYAKQVGHPAKIYLHAEIAAIIKAQKVGIPYKIKVVKTSKNGKLSPQRPCTICLAAIHEAEIKFVEYSVGE